MLRPDFDRWLQHRANQAASAQPAHELQDVGLAYDIYEAVLAQILVAAPERSPGGSTSTIVAFRAMAPQLELLSGGERQVLAEWLDRVIAAL